MSLSALGTGTLNYFDGTAWQPVGGAAVASTWPLRAARATNSVTYGGTAHTKSGWFEVIGSTTQDYALIVVASTSWAAGVQTSTLVDFGIGASGSESAIVENVFIGQDFRGDAPRPLPVRVPKGERLVARVQSNITSGSFDLYTQLYGGDMSAVADTLDVFGTDTATSGPTLFATNNVWYEMVASTAGAYRSVLLYPAASGSTFSTTLARIELGTGAAGSEVVVAANSIATLLTEAHIPGLGILQPSGSSTDWVYVSNVAAGTRISGRRQAGSGALAAFAAGIPA